MRSTLLEPRSRRASCPVVGLLRAAKAVDSLKLEGDEKVGAAIVGAPAKPIRQIVENAGWKAAWWSRR